MHNKSLFRIKKLYEYYQIKRSLASSSLERPTNKLISVGLTSLAQKKRGYPGIFQFSVFFFKRSAMHTIKEKRKKKTLAESSPIKKATETQISFRSTSREGLCACALTKAELCGFSTPSDPRIIGLYPTRFVRERGSAAAVAAPLYLCALKLAALLISAFSCSRAYTPMQIACCRISTRKSRVQW